MKRILLGGLMMLFFAAPACAEVLTFDDITTANGGYIPMGYGGFNWTLRDIYNCTPTSNTCPSLGNAQFLKYPDAAVSGDYVFYSVVDEMARVHGGPFSLLSAYAKPLNPGVIEDFEVTGFLNNTVVYDVSFIVNGANPPSLLTLGFDNVDRVRFFATTADATLLDNVNVSVPEPATLSLAAIGLVAIGMMIYHGGRSPSSEKWP